MKWVKETHQQKFKLISNLSPQSEAVNFTNNFWSFIHTQKVHFRVNVILICFRSICAKCHENPRKHSDKFLISRCISLAFQVAKNTNLRNCRPEVLYKKLFLISQNLQEKTCVRVRKTPVHEKEIPIQVFNGNFQTILRTSFLQNTSGCCYCNLEHMSFNLQHINAIASFDTLNDIHLHGSFIRPHQFNLLFYETGRPRFLENQLKNCHLISCEILVCIFIYHNYL